MSYDIMLHYNEIPAEVPMHAEGNVIAFNPETNETGMTSAEINITWNYSKFFYEHLDAERGIRWLYGKTGRETVERLKKAVEVLGTETDEDYWKPTPGNAGHILNVLAGWAELHPDAVWDGD